MGQHNTQIVKWWIMQCNVVTSLHSYEGPSCVWKLKTNRLVFLIRGTISFTPFLHYFDLRKVKKDWNNVCAKYEWKSNPHKNKQFVTIYLPPSAWLTAGEEFFFYLNASENRTSFPAWSLQWSNRGHLQMMSKML